MSHSHCPLGCDHPQPITADENPKLPPGAIPGREYCGRCWVQDSLLSEMVPCTMETCHDFIAVSITREPDPTGTLVEEPCNVVFDRKAPLHVYSPEEHGVLDAQFIAVEGGIGVQVEEPFAVKKAPST